MARAALLLLAGASGCLFVGDLNERPRAQLVASASSTTLGHPIHLRTTVMDDQRQPDLEIALRDADGRILDDACTAFAAKGDGPDGPAVDVTFWQPGTYTVEGTPVDTYGARGSAATFMLEVTDSPPAFSKPTLRISDQVTTACTGLYPATRPIRITYDGTVEDAEQTWTPPPAGCPNRAPRPLALTWRFVGRPTAGGILGPAPGGSCPEVPSQGADPLEGDTTLTTICLYPDPALPTGHGSPYELDLEVDDGRRQAMTDPLLVDVVGDAPACLDGVYPQAGDYVLPRDQATSFQAVGIDDVSPPSGLTYAWSLERPAQSAFVSLGPPVAADEGGARLVFDPVALGLGVGDDVRLRVEVIDPGGAAPACAVEDDTCTALSCAAAGASCPRRATWGIEIR